MTPDLIKLSHTPEGQNRLRVARFMRKVEVAGVENRHSEIGPCWNWTGSTGGSGYGQFWDGKRNIQAHWFLLEKRPEAGQEACHRCDNKLCVRPSHIFIGTRSDNMRDCSSKGRLNYMPGLKASKSTPGRCKSGSKNHEAKLTEEQAEEAKKCPRVYGAAAALAKRFGVSATVICGIRNEKRWKSPIATLQSKR